MNENERIKILRVTLKLNQTEFGARIGIKTSAVSSLERGVNAVSSQARKAICREFNVSETWLRTGEGEMLNPTPADEMDALAGQYGLSASEQALMKKFITLNPAKRKAALDYLGEVVAAVNADNAPYEAPPGANSHSAPQDMTPEEVHAELDRQLAEEKGRADASGGYGSGNSGTAAG